MTQKHAAHDGAVKSTWVGGFYKNLATTWPRRVASVQNPERQRGRRTFNCVHRLFVCGPSQVARVSGRYRSRLRNFCRPFQRASIVIDGRLPSDESLGYFPSSAARIGNADDEALMSAECGCIGLEWFLLESAAAQLDHIVKCFGRTNG